MSSKRSKFKKLTRSEIDGLKPGGKLAEHGITVECLSNGDVRYSINIMVDAARIHRVIGVASEGVTRTRAEEFIEKVKTDAREGRLSLPKGRKLKLGFAEGADDYIARLQAEGGKNIKIKKRQIRMYLAPFFGTMRLDAITDFTVAQYKKRRIDAGAAAATINRELATLGHLLRRAVEWKWLDRLPTRPKKLEESKGRIIALTADQCDALMTAAGASADVDLWLFVAFGLNTAMRHSEILAARWDQLDLDRRRLFIPDAKAGQRSQPLTAELVDILRREREMRDDREGWIFASPHRDSATGHRARMGQSFADAVGRAGLDPALITSHVMRHTAITRLVESGAPLPTIQRISGHKTLTIVLRYAHVSDPHIDDAIRALGRTVPQRPANTITQELHTPRNSGRRGGADARPKLRAV
jgi:integrase